MHKIVQNILCSWRCCNAGGKLCGFPDAAAAGAADQLRQALERQHQRDRILAEGTQLISIYTDGSFTQADPVQHIPDRAGWGYIVVRQSENLCRMNNYLMLYPANDRYHGATHKSNNTGEVTAIGEALF